MALVALPAAGGTGNLRVELASHAVTTTLADAAPWATRQPELANGAIDGGGIVVTVGRSGLLEVVDARTGRTLDATPIAGTRIASVCRAGGELYVKTELDLIAIARAHGAVRWAQPTTSSGNAVALAGTVVDAWVDRSTNRFGVLAYDARTGRKLDAIELGATHGWYDVQRVQLAADGPGEVLVSTAFGIA